MLFFSFKFQLYLLSFNSFCFREWHRTWCLVNYQSQGIQKIIENRTVKAIRIKQKELFSYNHIWLITMSYFFWVYRKLNDNIWIYVLCLFKTYHRFLKIIWSFICNISFALKNFSIIRTYGVYMGLIPVFTSVTVGIIFMLSQENDIL